MNALSGDDTERSIRKYDKKKLLKTENRIKKIFGEIHSEQMIVCDNNLVGS